MLLTADEVSRSLSGSLKLLNRNPEGLGHFEVSVAAFWRSFAAILLTAPAFVVSLAEDRLNEGLPAEAGLFSAPELVFHEAILLVGCWLAFPLAMVAVVRRLGLGHRYVHYVITWNWSVVIAATLLAVPSALHVLGIANSGLVALCGLAFGIIIVQYRWFIAKAALGVPGGVAALVVLLDVSLSSAVAESLATLV